MLELEQIKSHFPTHLRDNSSFDKYILKEYLQLMILDFLSSTPHIHKLSFIGDTNLRLIKRLNRFSEDIDFDCKQVSAEDFITMTDAIKRFLERSGLEVEAKGIKNTRLTAFRSNLYFPELLFNLGISGHKEQRFLIKIEGQDQGIDYTPKSVNIKGCGFFFPFPVPSDSILCSMKIAALLSRAKGRDFYDAMFLLSITQPDYDFLSERSGINNLAELKIAISELLNKTDLRKKRKDFEHLLFDKSASSKILLFRDFIDSLHA